ncbi:MAG: membrane protein [Nitrospirales bacterium]|nr:MAG: membrane protein [Nitrospirales bacterium]
MEWLTDPEAWLALGTLTALEIVLGIDNIIFISILAGKLPVAEQARARVLGLGVAMFSRLALLFSLSWLMGLTAPWFAIFGHDFSGRDLILIAGGLFLLVKSTLEIHERLEGQESEGTTSAATSFTAVIVQIAVLDIVFSLDSVITAIGMADQVWVMAMAIIIAVGVMMVSSGAISEFIDEHPTIKILALSFLLLVGVMLIGEGFSFHIPKGYIYFAMAFSVFVELINSKIRKGHTKPVKLRQPSPE